jgi:hypothetical protein
MRHPVDARGAALALVVFAPMAVMATSVGRVETPPKRRMAVSPGSGIATAAFLVARWLHGQHC